MGERGGRGRGRLDSREIFCEAWPVPSCLAPLANRNRKPGFSPIFWVFSFCPGALAIVVRPKDGRGRAPSVRRERKVTGHFSPFGPSLFRSRTKGFLVTIDRCSRDNERASWLLLRGPQRSPVMAFWRPSIY